MLFGSAAIFAILAAGGMSSSVRPAPCTWREAGPSARCARPLAPPTIDLRLMAPTQTQTTATTATDMLRRKLPFEVKSVKIVGASGFGVFFPLFENVSIGVAATAFKTAPHEKALQVVAGVRVRF